MIHSKSRFILRDMTRGDHERLDALVGQFTDAPAYARYVNGMAIFRGGIEQGLASIDYPPHFDDWRPGLIASELMQDLRDLGHQTPDDVAPFDLPADDEGLLGVLYVLEGSALGARLLSRRAAELGFSAERGARHLAAQTSRPEAWNDFVILLERLDPMGIDKAAHAARRTFGAAYEAFNGKQ
jgi:heme oxygenase